MTLTRRTAKQCFVNVFSKRYAVINISDLQNLDQGTIIDSSFLKANGFIKKLWDGVKVLGNGELKKSLIFKDLIFSESAKKKIEAAGGKIELSKVVKERV